MARTTCVGLFEDGTERVRTHSRMLLWYFAYVRRLWPSEGSWAIVTLRSSTARIAQGGYRVAQGGQLACIGWTMAWKEAHSQASGFVGKKGLGEFIGPVPTANPLPLRRHDFCALFATCFRHWRVGCHLPLNLSGPTDTDRSRWTVTISGPASEHPKRCRAVHLLLVFLNSFVASGVRFAGIRFWGPTVAPTVPCPTSCLPDGDLHVAGGACRVAKSA